MTDNSVNVVSITVFFAISYSSVDAFQNNFASKKPS
jgi:hypothetical protein